MSRSRAASSAMWNPFSGHTRPIAITKRRLSSRSASRSTGTPFSMGGSRRTPSGAVRAWAAETPWRNVPGRSGRRASGG